MKNFSVNQYSKTGAIILAMILSGLFIQAQDITGQWKVQEEIFQVIIHINKTDKGYASTLDDLDEGAFGIPMTATTFDGSKLLLVSPIGISFEGVFKTDSIVGIATQGDISLPLTLKRVPAEEKPTVIP